MKLGLVIPHIFMHREVLPHVIFSPATLALDLVEGLQAQGVEVTLFSPGPVDTTVTNITADLSYFEHELHLRGDSYLDLLKKHPFTFITLGRQVQSELIAQAFAMANDGELDIVHIYTNEEDIALPFARLCQRPVVFTHHDPFNFLVKYKNVFPKYGMRNWISTSLAQRKGMPAETKWAGNVYHGLSADLFQPLAKPTDDYAAYLGRIIEPKGVHLAIQAVQTYNKTATQKLSLKIAGKHYADHKKDRYWQEKVLPLVDGQEIQYIGFIKSTEEKQTFLGNARALLVPSVFDEPFGMVMIEALACGTPVIGLDSGAIPEVLSDARAGLLVQKVRLKEQDGIDEQATVNRLAKALQQIGSVDRQGCRQAFDARFTAHHMCQEHLAIYQSLIAG